ncbi:hypothetical protein EYZ11_001973 [Aspergillus tanneri]|uniref:DNA-directed RNA polymerase III subunit rpc5 n=1 Tax=Aspergillus tanneri TaxID=1220188 RepID=A0A4S3JRV0_9EURO|nr:uncharacterized protein ATNIH1004_004171 [Aspergillus tanneri]KAA8648287.1 hypothetical protein ATNIH1004_004171 [Aspergillus tanneri]THC98543.1 hypothetical protein EYZ11_001973 [Aspergillus tanneri]
MTSSDLDPVIASYDVYLTDSEISRFVLQYLDRPAGDAYDDRHGQKPAAFRIKPKTGLVEVDVPINTRVNYDVNKGLRYGDALKRSRNAREGSAFGMAGGFSSGGVGGKVKMEGAGDVEMSGMGSGESASLLRMQTLGGRIKNPENGDPVYMLAAFRGKNLHLSPVSAVVQLHPQLHHLDALDEIPAKGKGGKGRKDGDDERQAESEARAIDVKIKAAEDGEGAMVAGNLDLLKKMQDEKWDTYNWVDAETEESWNVYESYMMHQDPENLPQLDSAINSEDYLDTMSAPRIDPARPEMTGWAMKQNRKKQGDLEGSGGPTEL